MGKDSDRLHRSGGNAHSAGGSAMRNMWRNRPLLVAYLLILSASAGAFAWQGHLGQQRKEQICYAEMEDRLLWKDTISYLGTQSPQVDTSKLSPEIRKLVEDSRVNSKKFYTFMQSRVEIPPKICSHSGVTEDQVIRDQIRRGTRESTTTTTVPGG